MSPIHPTVKRKLHHATLEIHFGFFLLLAFMLCTAQGDGFWAVAAALLLHETGHMVAARLCHVPIRTVRISGFGVDLEGDFQRASPLQRALVSAAGPLTNAVLGAAFLFLEQEVWAVVELLLAVFHGLPMQPLDGGAVLQNLLLLFCGLETAERVTRAISLALVLLTGVAGFFLLLRTRYNFTLLLAAMYGMGYLLFRERIGC